MQLTKSIHNEKYRELIDNLKCARIEAGLSQQQVADVLGKPQSYIAKVEGYERRLDIIELIEFSNEVNADIIKLVSKLICK